MFCYCHLQFSILKFFNKAAENLPLYIAIATLFSKADLNKLRRTNVMNEITLICAKFVANLINNF